MRIRRGIALAIVVVAAAAGPARAQPEAPVSDVEAQRAMERGLAAAARGDHEAALAEYEAAAKLVPSANLPHRYAGDELVALQRYEEAVASYETYLRLRSGVKDAAAVRQRIDEIRAKYIEGTLDVVCTPNGARVTIDDAATALGATPIRGVKLHAGAHRVAVHADGFRDATLTAAVRAGGASVLGCTLERVTAARPTETSPPSHLASTLLFVGGGVALAAGGTAAVWAEVTADRERSSVDPVEKPALRDAAHGRAILADVGFGLSIALVATAVVLRATVERAEPRAAAARPLTWSW